MKNLTKLFALLVFVILCLQTNAQPGFGGPGKDVIREFTPKSLDKIAPPEYDFQRANKLPLTGYFEKSFEVNGQNRTAKIYISSAAPVRPFFTVIAVPEKVNTTDFLVASGWHDLAEKNEECLLLLEAGKDGWGDVNSEKQYIDSVMKFYSRNNYFSTFGISYLLGFDGGGTALEVWSAENPLKVISQVFINTESLRDDFYETQANKFMDGSSSGYKAIEIPEEIRIASNEIPVPTLFINSDLSKVETSMEYWSDVNDVETASSSIAEYFWGAKVYPQAKDSKAWATAYSGPVSKVATLEAASDVLDPNLNKIVHEFLTEYVAYDNTTAYGRHLALRKPYGEIRNMLVKNELREFQVYVSESAAKMWPEGAPVVFVFPGNSQTDKVFFHNTLWWKVADQEGCILVIVCETYSNNSVSVSHANTGLFYEQLADYMKKYYQVDTTRFYATGQSAGSFAVQGFGITNPDYFAAIASTSGLSSVSNEAGFGRTSVEDASYKTIPNYCIIGEGDIEMMTGTLWDDTENMLDAWAEYYLKANKLGSIGDGSNVEKDGRFYTWTWKNEQDIPLFKVGRTLYRAHNCIPAEMPRLYDFLKHWSLKEGVRYYDGVAVK
ncbi:hypothetical protein SLH46_09220 [Draconibacterium sp. IB214405]|uniref:hypothetical protein n=1 Tax=Draconibacterium sp. IB214405 TaxID=3097352 RepID=UPI002A132A6C|nr:hypothetical protein [Draconibacterium sp. IB214405]MDX8339360.1 hypothetical protein [Draconibacterium sp. IB214405]